jgi:RNA methyltransferase, TrmH family
VKKMLKKITSATNPLIQEVVKLHSTKYRTQLQKFIAEGFRTVSTLTNNGMQPLTLFVTEELLDDALTLTSDEKIILVTSTIMDKISTTQSPSGILALCAIPPTPSFNQLGTGIVLAQLQDPGNVGTLIRTAAAMNKKTVVCIESVDPWNPKVVQASAGTIGMVTIFTTTWSTLLKEKGDLIVCALTVENGKKPDPSHLKNALIVIGNEAYGIPDEWVAQCEEKITLPMPGACESLNAAVAGSIALYLSTIR